MEIKKIRVHTCNQEIEGYIQKKCRCRKFVTLEKATELMNDGYANNIIESFKTVDIKTICSMCAGMDAYKKSCTFCGKTGETLKKFAQAVYGENIYMRPFLKTPRTATIEEEHVEYAYVKRDKDAIKRIELYQDLNRQALVELGAGIVRKTVTGKVLEVVIEGHPEPEDDASKWQGRTYDQGRSI
jgi:glutaredoxin